MCAARRMAVKRVRLGLPTDKRYTRAMVEPNATDRLPPAAPEQRMQRLRVGITGLAAVLLVVLLATAVATGVRRTAISTPNAAASSVATVPASNAIDPNSEPLAQLGVAPGATDKTHSVDKPK